MMRDLLLRMLRASAGLLLFSLGVRITIQADIGLGPWDTFADGLSKHLGLSFGTTSIVISLIILIVDLCLRERIGVGTVLDSLLVGVGLNLWEALDLVPLAPKGVWPGCLMMIVGLFLMAFSQYLYMSACLCCGPRDTLLVGLGKRLRRVPIGAVEILILVVVLGVGFLLGGRVGIGTLLSVFGTGIAIQIVFRLLRFEPRALTHEGFKETLARFAH